jgi:hypothetical protein
MDATLEHWLGNFFNKDIITPNSDIINYINKNKFTNNIEVKIDELEIDFNSKMQEIINTFENEDITKLYKNKNSLEILQKESEIVKLISKYSLQNNKLEYTFIVNCLRYLYELSEILRGRLKQTNVSFNKTTNAVIVRCSYKFCNYKENCTYNYGKKGLACYQDHFVHNMVSHDVMALISYIEEHHQDGDMIMHNKEILKTINTLSFVIGHMEGELKSKCLYNDIKDCEKYHHVNAKNV